MAIFKRSDSPYWFIEFVFKGRRYRESTATTRRRKAEEYERQRRQQVYDEITLGRREHEPMRFVDAVRRYASTHLKTKLRLEETATSDAYLLAKLTTLIGPDTQLDEITTELVADLKESILNLDGGRMPATVNKYLATLRAILRMAYFEWCRVRALPRFKLYPLNNERTRWLRAEEELRLLRACDRVPHLRDLVMFLIDTGARLSEACRLTWDEVEMPKRGRGVIRLFATKTQQWRSVPLTSRADRLLRNLADRRPVDQERVFLVRTCGCHWRNTLARAKPFKHPHGAWVTAVKAADLGDLHLHDLRHTFASRLVQRNVPLLTVSQLLGHSDIRMTMRYAHLATETLKHAVAKLD
jgi:integrase